VTKPPSTAFTIESRIADDERRARAGHRGGVLWFTGLPGAGKSTLAVELERRLFAEGYSVYVLDGDNLRTGLNADLGFSHADRTENIRRVGQVAALFANAGIIAISAFISPYRDDRRQARTAAADAFREVYVKADVETCEQRDPKGLYRRARKGEIPDFTGVSAPYEVPASPDFVVDTVADDVAACTDALVAYVEAQFGLLTIG
jgi:bifunctional enzyme CysN/CysC